MGKKEEALNRAKKAHLLRNVTFAIAIVTGIYFACALDNSGLAYVVAVIGLVVSFLLVAATMAFERYALCTLIKNDLKISYHPIFYWYDLSPFLYEKSSKNHKQTKFSNRPTNQLAA